MKRSSAGAPTAGLHSTSVVVGFGGQARRRGRRQSPRAQPRARGEFSTMYPVSGDGRESSQTVHRESGTMHLVRLELTFGTLGELLCLVAGPDINRT